MSLGKVGGGTKDGKNHCTLKVTDLCKVEEERELLLSFRSSRGEDER
jgi:hypothetical protein